MTREPLPAWPGNHSELDACFRADELPDEWLPRGTQADRLVELLALYRAHGLAYTPRKLALCDVCMHAEGCWATLDRKARRRPTAVWYRENGGIVLPWVGRRYERGGVAVIGINPNIAGTDYTSLLLEHGISWEHYISTFQAGKLREGRSSFGGCAMRTAGLLLDELDGRPIEDRGENPLELVDVVHRTARLQAVKCVPKRAKSEPSREMIERCPSFLFADELAILRPSRIVMFGAPARDAMQEMLGYQSPAGRLGHVRYGDLTGDGWSARVFALAHPNAWDGAWDRSFRALKRRLGREQRSC